MKKIFIAFSAHPQTLKSQMSDFRGVLEPNLGKALFVTSQWSVIRPNNVYLVGLVISSLEHSRAF